MTESEIKAKSLEVCKVYHGSHPDSECGIAKSIEKFGQECYQSGRKEAFEEAVTLIINAVEDECERSRGSQGHLASIHSGYLEAALEFEKLFAAKAKEGAK